MPLHRTSSLSPLSSHYACSTVNKSHSPLVTLIWLETHLPHLPAKSGKFATDFTVLYTVSAPDKDRGDVKQFTVFSWVCRASWLLTCIHKLHGSSLGRDTDCSDWRSSWYSSVPRENSETAAKLGHSGFLVHPLKSIIHHYYHTASWRGSSAVYLF
jgi:hypothetical protein